MRITIKDLHEKTGVSYHKLIYFFAGNDNLKKEELEALKPHIEAACNVLARIDLLIKLKSLT